MNVKALNFSHVTITPEGHTFDSIAFHGNLIVALKTYTSGIWMWNKVTGAPAGKRDIRNGTSHILSANDNVIVVGTLQGSCEFLSITRQYLDEYSCPADHKKSITAITCGAKYLYTAGEETNILVSPWGSKKAAATLKKHKNDINLLLEDGSYLYSYSYDGTLIKWDLTKFKPALEDRGGAVGMIIDEAFLYVPWQGKIIKRDKESLRTLSELPIPDSSMWLHHAAVTPKFLIAGGADHLLYIFDKAKEELLQVFDPGHSERIKLVYVDDQRLYTASMNELKIWPLDKIEAHLNAPDFVPMAVSEAREEAARKRADEEKARRNLAQEQRRRDLLSKMVKVADMLTMKQVAMALELSEEETAERIHDWAAEFGFSIDENQIIIPRGRKEDSLDE